jgi:acetyltransferase-like isoleucine patch superfamily enzyme
MRQGERIVADRFVDIEYHQFTQSTALRIAITLTGVLTWPIVLPLALIARLSDFLFVTCSQLLSLIPYLLGTIMRYEYYRFTLRHCGRNVMVGFGTVFLYRDIAIGDHVLIGMYNTVHHCDFGSFVLTAEGCRFLSGPHYHNYDRLDVPMALQGGKLRRIRVADDCWIGANAVVMNDVGKGSVVAAGAVVTDAVEPLTVVGGVPARLLRRRQ